MRIYPLREWRNGIGVGEWRRVEGLGWFLGKQKRWSFKEKLVKVKPLEEPTVEFKLEAQRVQEPVGESERQG